MQAEVMSQGQQVRGSVFIDLTQARRRHNAEAVETIFAALQTQQSTEDRALDMVVDRLLDRLG